jgi:hypothetical protein
MNLPSGEICEPEISGSPKKTSLSRRGGDWAKLTAADATRSAVRTRIL